MNFPINLNKFRGLPINRHPGSFGFNRSYYSHTGIDLYADTDDEVFAIRPGVVVKIGYFTGPQAGSKYWLPTDAVLVKDTEGYYLYGELTSDLKINDELKEGDLIGRLKPVIEKKLQEYPGHSATMLHLERLNFSYDPSLDWPDWLHSSPKRPEYLEDPTPELMQILRSKDEEIKLLWI
jgi:hypothetical protein